jgi:hypothetical protein
MNYSINKKFCTPKDAKNIIDFCTKNGEVFSYRPDERWDCRRMYDEDFKKEIIEKLTERYKSKEFNLWFDYNNFDLKNFNISLTAYYEGRYLNLHKDITSELTTVIVLSDGFNGGQFALSEDIDPPIHFESLKGVSTFDLELGDAISFNVSKTYHGVLPVTEGIRYALNIWMTETDFDYPRLKYNKTIL